MIKYKATAYNSSIEDDIRHYKRLIKVYTILLVQTKWYYLFTIRRTQKWIKNHQNKIDELNKLIK